MMKNFYYTDIDGDHFPDASKGSELFYSIEFSCWLTNEKSIVTSVTWEVGSGLQLLANFIQGTEAKVKVSADSVGSHSMVCSITTAEGGLAQLKKIPMILKVY
jgi:hypothetical protein